MDDSYGDTRGPGEEKVALPEGQDHIHPAGAGGSFFRKMSQTRPSWKGKKMFLR